MTVIIHETCLLTAVQVNSTVYTCGPLRDYHNPTLAWQWLLTSVYWFTTVQDYSCNLSLQFTNTSFDKLAFDSRQRVERMIRPAPNEYTNHSSTLDFCFRTTVWSLRVRKTKLARSAYMAHYNIVLLTYFTLLTYLHSAMRAENNSFNSIHCVKPLCINMWFETTLVGCNSNG